MSYVNFADSRYQCPGCGCLTDSPKRYTFMRGVFLIYGMGWNYVTVVACPRCMRRYLVKWGLTSLLTMNFLWPALILPYLVTRYASTFRRGDNFVGKSLLKHSAGIVAQLGIIGGTMFATLAILLMLFDSSSNLGFLSTILGASVLAFGAMVVLGTFADL